VQGKGEFKNTDVIFYVKKRATVTDRTQEDAKVALKNAVVQM
jgi:hypothetical protein